MSGKLRLLIGCLVTLVGAASLVASWRLEGEEAWSSAALLEIGAAVFLLLPLLFFERLFERRVQQVERDTATRVAGVRDEVATVRSDLAAALGELQKRTEERLAEQRASDEAVVQRARQDVSLENVQQLLEAASNLDAVSPSGVRVPVPNGWPRIKFETVRLVSPSTSEVEERFSVSVVDVRGNYQGVEVTWRPDQRGPDVIAELIEDWQRAGSYPGAGFLNADSIFEGLITTIAMAIDRRRRGDEQSLGRVIERTSEHWALTESGMEHLGFPPYGLDAEKIAKEPQLLREHMLDKTWVLEDEEEFKTSFEVARMYFQGPEASRRATSPPF